MIASVCTDSEIPEAEKVIDAEGKYLLPGMIESHMHVREPGRPDRGTFFTETKARVAAGGVTTILEHPIAKPPQYSKGDPGEKNSVMPRTNVSWILLSLGGRFKVSR